MDLPATVRLELLKFLPKDDLPGRLKRPRAEVEPPTEPAPITVEPPGPHLDQRRLIWGYIRHAPGFPDGGERVGEATSAVTPWPHQARAFQRHYGHWPPHLLIADEVGLGKTIQAGLLLRQAWLAGRARRMLVLAPKAVLRQWQIELREKFNLNWPIYDGQRLCWLQSPGLQGEAQRLVGPKEWHREPFVLASSHLMRRRDRAAERDYGAMREDAAMYALPGLSRLKVRKVLKALRDAASIPLKQLETAEREVAVRLMKLNTPLRALVSRHTRELLRRCHAAGKLKTPIATRRVEDRFVEMTAAERQVYEQVEDYIGTYNNAAAQERTAVGFVMTIYRRRLASSFHALITTLDRRLASVGGQMAPDQDTNPAIDEDMPDDELADEAMDTDQAVDLEQRALALEETGDIRALLAAAKRLPHDTKAGVLIEVLRELREQGYQQTMVFTQYTRDWSWLAPGMAGPVRVTTDPDYFEQHPDSTELWSPGSPLFPVPDVIAAPQELEGLDLSCLMRAAGSERAKPGTKE